MACCAKYAETYCWISLKHLFQLSGGGKSSQDVIEELASDILTKIPPDFNLEEVQVCSMYPTG